MRMSISFVIIVGLLLIIFGLVGPEKIAKIGENAANFLASFILNTVRFATIFLTRCVLTLIVVSIITAIVYLISFNLLFFAIKSKDHDVECFIISAMIAYPFIAGMLLNDLLKNIYEAIYLDIFGVAIGIIGAVQIQRKYIKY